MVIKVLLIVVLYTSFSNEKIAWSNEVKLTWEDFKGRPDRSSPFVAMTNSGIVFSYQVTSKNGNLSLTTEVEARFHPKMSWYKPEKVNNHVLQHEQGHFNITEIHARKLKKAFAAYQVTKNYERELTAIFTRIKSERQAMQDRYDKETNHSQNKEKEAEWQTFINSELKNLEQWKN
jgi:hypothetical protein